MPDLIFGYTWDEIRAAQQGKPLKREIPDRIPGAEKDNVFLPGDIELLTRYGIKELENRGYNGVIDRLAQAGIIGA
jgi:hypothetical protein